MRSATGSLSEDVRAAREPHLPCTTNPDTPAGAATRGRSLRLPYSFFSAPASRIPTASQGRPASRCSEKYRSPLVPGEVEHRAAESAAGTRTAAGIQQICATVLCEGRQWQGVSRAGRAAFVALWRQWRHASGEARRPGLASIDLPGLSIGRPLLTRRRWRHLTSRVAGFRRDTRVRRNAWDTNGNWGRYSGGTNLSGPVGPTVSTCHSVLAFAAIDCACALCAVGLVDIELASPSHSRCTPRASMRRRGALCEMRDRGSLTPTGGVDWPLASQLKQAPPRRQSGRVPVWWGGEAATMLRSADPSCPPPRDSRCSVKEKTEMLFS